MNLKEKLSRCELTIGSWVMLGNTSVVEVLSYAGFEWLVVDLEHTDISLESAKLLIQTIQSRGMSALVRVSKNEEVVIKRVLDLGADGIIVPMVRNKKDAQRAVEYSKYPPQGKRGVGLYRAQGYGSSFEEYKRWVNEELVIIAQIEHIDAVHNISEILSVRDIDGAIIGPYDLSASMGIAGELDAPEVVEAVETVFDACIENKRSVGFHVVNTDPAVFLEKVKLGGNLMAYGIDYFFLRDKAIEGMIKIKGEQ